jgi:uncharacterized protein DUF3107
VDVRIGIVQAAREIDIELGEDTSESDLVAKIEAVLKDQDGVLWLQDRRGRRVVVAGARIAYVEIGAPDQGRRVGYGA